MSRNLDPLLAHLRVAGKLMRAAEAARIYPQQSVTRMETMLDDHLIEPIEERRRWTLRRIVFTILIIITLIAFLTYVLLASWLYTANAPHPRPTPTIEVQRG